MHRTTFDEALAQGLYRRICRKNGEAWTAEGQAAWAEQVRDFYGDDAQEELDGGRHHGQAAGAERRLRHAAGARARDPRAGMVQR